MRIDLKKVMLAGTAIAALGVAMSPGEARAQCATSGVFAADCTFSSSDTEGTITLNTGVDVVFSSTTGQIEINDPINSAATGDGTLATVGNGTTIVYQSADIGVGANHEISALTIGSGDFWYLSANAIELSSGGVFTIDGGTLSFISGGATISGPDATPNNLQFSGGSSADTILFASAASAQAQGATSNYIYASSFNLAGGNDVITFSSGDNNIDANDFDLGDGNDTVTFNSGRIFSSGDFDAGAGNDTITFSSADTTTGGEGLIQADNVYMGSGNDSIVFNSSGSINVGAGTLSMDSGNDTITFQSGGSITAATIDGGSGTDTLNFYSAGTIISSDVTGFETVNLGVRSDVTLSNGSLTSAAVMMYESANLNILGTSTETVSGTITGDDNGQSIVVDNGGVTVSSTISLAGGNDVIDYRSGSITGAVAFGAGNDVLNVGSANSDLTLTAAVSGIEDIMIDNGTLTVSAAITGVDDANDQGVNVGANTLVLESGASIDGAIHGAAGGSLVFNSSGNGGTFSLGGIVEDVQLYLNSGGTLNTNGFDMGGNVALALAFVSGTLNATDSITTDGNFVTGGSTTIGYDDIITVNNGDIGGGGTYTFMYYNSAGTEMIGGVTATAGSIDFSSASLVFSVAPGSGVVTTGTNVIVFASAGGAATAGASVSDTSYLYDFAVNDTGSNLGLDITQAVSLSEATSTGNNQTVATVLLTDPDLVTSTDSNLQALQAAVSGATTQEEFNDALEQAQPTIDGSSVTTALAISNSSFNLVSDRLAALRTGDSVTGMTTGNLSQGVRAWTQGFGVTGQQDRRDGIDGYDFDTYGVAFGADTENLLSDGVIGLAFSYANTDADSDNASLTSTDTDSYQFTIYGDHNFEKNIYLNGMAAYAHNSVDTSRLVAGSTATGDFDADQFTVRAEVGRDYNYDALTLSPHVLGHWTHYDPDSYTESGAGGAGLIVNSDSVNIAELGLGVNASWLYRNANGSYFSPEVSLDYRYDFAGDEVEMTSRFVAGGAAFKTTGFDAQQSSVDAGLGFTYYSTDNWELTAEYNYEWKEDFDAHAGMARAAYRF